VLQFARTEDLVSEQVNLVDPLDPPLDLPINPLEGRFASQRPQRIGERLEGPTNRLIPWTDRHCSTAHRGNAYHRMQSRGLVANENHHGAAWNTLIRAGPGMSKVPPNVSESQARKFAALIVMNKLEIWSDDFVRGNKALSQFV
jgi:hypothetical protein